MFARIQEEELEKQRTTRTHIAPVGRPPPPIPPAATIPARAAAPPRPGGDDYARERQLREFKRANGLCFRCGDKYSREHQCKRTGQILMIEVGDFGEILSDDTVLALQLLDAPGAQEPQCCSLSHTICLRAQVEDQIMLLLVDSGSTHSFISETFVSRLIVQTEKLPPVSVRVANGRGCCAINW